MKLIPQWIPREQNAIANSLSRFSDCDDWGINREVYEMLDFCWDKHTVDRFATDYGTKCTRFNSKYWYKGTEAVDAVTENFVMIKQMAP